MGEFAIGQAVSRFEDPRLIRGGGRYVDDMRFPAWPTASCCARRTRMRKIKSIDTSAAKAAPGVLAVLTGADWKASGFGDLPVPARLEAPRRLADLHSRAIRRWPRTACAGSATTSPSSWPRRAQQALDAAELIEVDYEPLPAVTSTAEALKPGAPRVWDDCPDNICFVATDGDKAATDAAFASAAHVVKHRFVINRVTAATHGAARRVGVYDAGDGRYTIYTTLQRAHPLPRRARARCSRCRRARCASSPATSAAASA